MAERYVSNNIFEEISPIISLNSTGNTYFEITEQKVHRLGNVVYITLIVHKIASIVPSIEYTIGTCNIKPKGNTVFSHFGGFNSIVIQFNGNIIFVDNSDTRNWYNISGSFIAQ